MRKEQSYASLYPNVVTGPDTILRCKLWAGPTSPGKVFDYSLNGNLGTLNGTDIAPVYPGFSFNGTDDYIALTNDVGRGFAAFSVSAWVKRTANGIIIASSSGGSINWWFKMGGDRAIFGLNIVAEGVKTASSTDRPSANIWHHIMGVYDGVNVKVYVNGVVTVGDATTGVISSNAYVTWIGARSSAGPQERFTGSLDDIIAFNTAKSAQQVRSIYESTRWRYGV